MFSVAKKSQKPLVNDVKSQKPLVNDVNATAVAPSNRRNRRHPHDVNGGRGRRWASTKQTADHLQVTVRTVRLMVADGRLTKYRLGPRVVRFDLDEVDAAMTPAGGDA
jgi:excisionase family DNA binding protein